MTDQTIRVILTGDSSGLAAAATVANKQLASVGQTSKQTAAAMRGVPAQITDIVTSLQGGQSPLTVFLQQGGQLKDMFGGIRPAAAALGSTLVGLINPVTLAGAAIAAFGAGIALGAMESARLRGELLLTNNAAGLTDSTFNAMARTVATSADVTVGSAREVAEGFVASGKVSGQALTSISQAAAMVANVSDKSSDAVVGDFLKMTAGVTSWAQEHNSAWHFATAAQLENIRSLEDAGRAQEAMVEVNRLIITQLKPYAENLGYVERAWLGVKEAISRTVEATKAVGRPSDAFSRAQDSQGILSQIERGNLYGGNGAKDAALSEANTRNRDAIRLQDFVGQQAADAQTTEETIKRRNELRTVTERLSGASSEYAKTLKTIQESAKAGDITEQQRIQLLTEAATKYGTSAPKGPKRDLEAEYRKMVRDTLANRAPRLADMEAQGYEAANRAAAENMAKTAEEQKRRNDQAAAMAQQLVSETEQIYAGLIPDAQQRGLQLIEIDRRVQQARIDGDAAAGVDISAQQDALNANIIAKQSALAEQMKPQWQKLIDGWADTNKTIQDGFDGATTNMLEGAADAFGRWASGQKVTIKSLVQSWIAEMAAAQFKAAIGSAASNLGSSLVGVFGGASGGGTAGSAGSAGDGGFQAAQLSAKGNVYTTSPGLSAHSGTVVNRPTFFAFAKGVGLMGEAGPEAILPLQRGPGGKLGVQAAGAGAKPSVTIHLSPVLHIDARSDQAQISTMVVGAMQETQRGMWAQLRARGIA